MCVISCGSKVESLYWSYNNYWKIASSPELYPGATSGLSASAQIAQELIRVTDQGANQKKPKGGEANIIGVPAGSTCRL